MKASYPITPKNGKRTTPADIHWCEKIYRGKKYRLDKKSLPPLEIARTIAGYENRAIVFFSDLAEQVGELIPHLLNWGKLEGAGDQVRSLHYVQDGKKIFLSDASLYFFDPTSEKMEALNKILFEELRVRLAPTPGNSAMRIIRRFIEIKALFQPSDRIREISRAALTGGALHWKNGDYDQAYKYDIHSAYGWAMREAHFPLQPTFHTGIPNTSADGMILVAEVDFETGKKFSPLVVYGSDDEAYHPTKAERTLVAFNQTDLNIFIDNGEFNFRPRDVRASITWRKGPQILGETMNQIDRVQEAYHEIKPAMKIIRNACFGKFAEHDEMNTFTLVKCDRALLAGKRAIVDIIESGNALFALVREARYNPAPQHNPIFAGLITSEIRRRIYETIDKNTVYVDTDGFISTTKRNDLSQGPGFGDWYLDEQGRSVILGPRIYAMAGKSKIAGQHEPVAMKELTRALVQEIRVHERITPNPLLMEKIRSSERTLRAIKYPHVEARGDTLYVTRSPTVRIKSKLPDWI